MQRSPRSRPAAGQPARACPRHDGGPGRGARLLAGVVGLLLVPSAALAAPAPSGHSAVDAQASRHAPVEGPSAPGVAWRTDLGVDLAGRVHEDPFPVADGHVVVAGRIENHPTRSGQGYLNAVDTATGAVAWDAPFYGIDPKCNPAVTADGRVLAQLQARGVANDGQDNPLVAIDLDTGTLVSGQSFTSDAPRLKTCESRVVIAGDTVLLSYGGSSSGIRAVDISSTPWTEAWNFEARTADDTAVGNGRNDQVVVDATGTTAYYLSVKDASASPKTWWLNAIRVADGSVRDRIDLPGVSSADYLKRLVAVKGGVVVALAGCDGQPVNNQTGCVARIADNGTTLSQDWVTRPTDTAGQRQTISTLTVTGTGVVAGWTLGTGRIYGLSLASGAVAFRHDPSSFSNNGGQLISDADGTLVHGAFGGNYLEGFDDQGRDLFAVPDCATSTPTRKLAEPSTIGGIAADGTLVTGNTAGVYSNGTRTGETYVMLGLRDGANAASGDCPATEERVSGLNRIETAVEVSQASFPQQDAADTVVLAVSTNYPDALSGGPLARKVDGPLLLTERDALNPATRAEIRRLGASRAILLGGTAALGPAVESELRSMGLATDRIAGQDRFDTARLVARRVPATTVYVTEGANVDARRGWPDAVAVSGLAAFEQRPILLVTRDEAPAATRQALAELGATRVVVVGGTVAVSDATAAALADYVPGGNREAAVTREAGASRYATSVKIAQRSVAAGASTRDLWFATGLTFPDALTAGPAVARSGGVLLLVHGQDPAGGQEVYDYLSGLKGSEVQRAWFVGGTAAISDPVAQRVAGSLGIG